MFSKCSVPLFFENFFLIDKNVRREQARSVHKDESVSVTKKEKKKR